MWLCVRDFGDGVYGSTFIFIHILYTNSDMSSVRNYLILDAGLIATGLCKIIIVISRHDRVRNKRKQKKSGIWQDNPGPSDIRSDTDTLDCLMTEECRIVLIPKLSSNLAVSNTLKPYLIWQTAVNQQNKALSVVSWWHKCAIRRYLFKYAWKDYAIRYLFKYDWKDHGPSINQLLLPSTTKSRTPVA